MESPDLLGAMVTVIPRATSFTSVSPSGVGATWSTVHGIVGMDAVGNPQWLSDGMNEQGQGDLYIPDFGDYESTDGVETSTNAPYMDWYSHNPLSFWKKNAS